MAVLIAGLFLLAADDPQPAAVADRSGGSTTRRSARRRGSSRAAAIPASSGSTTTRATPPPCSRSGATARSSASIAVSVPNVDWEDIAIDDDGHLYLGDIGNNGGRLPLRADLPARRARPRNRLRPAASRLTRRRRLLSVSRRTAGSTPRACSSTAAARCVVAKTFDGREAELFAVPLDPPAPLLRPALPEPLGTLAGLHRARHRGRPLARTAGAWRSAPYDGSPRLRTRRPRPDGWTLVGDGPITRPTAIEAIAWDGDDLILAGEGGGLFRIADADLARWPRVEDREPDRCTDSQRSSPCRATTSSSSAAG